MEFSKAERNRCKIKLALQGASGSGKTYSALLIAFGLTGDWSKIAVLDSENGSAHLYSHLGGYYVLNMASPFSPEKYVEAIKTGVEKGFQCLIIDSLSAEWNGSGGILDVHSNIPGNSFTAWAKVTPRHNAFIQSILQSDIHVIATMRSKTEYLMQEKNGKQVPEKVGLKAVQREDTEYEFTVVMELNQRHQATISKDRTGLFVNRPELILSAEIGKEIASWCSSVSVTSSCSREIPPPKEQTFEDLINACETVDALAVLYNDYPEQQAMHRDVFVRRKNQISSMILNLV
ncbi:MAG: AAA family ATPase [Bacteroidetes bacterium RIFOXYA12_FULL_35_11]|nr:MAG: AAA family ATPase [Bacteroidetes bacterium GWF2_35_48]OFY76252.1 MAG: AAA family ATPase [Bacteroidetes bacterium RIFOXYA12_FULL_35_11]OFY94485.1 MAG: AAA family ATPase [Bacteroidetes bacterium RIFOXYC12_FULL_35_7]